MAANTRAIQKSSGAKAWPLVLLCPCTTCCRLPVVHRSRLLCRHGSGAPCHRYCYQAGRSGIKVAVPNRHTMVSHMVLFIQLSGGCLVFAWLSVVLGMPNQPVAVQPENTCRHWLVPSVPVCTWSATIQAGHPPCTLCLSYYKRTIINVVLIW